MKDLTILAVLLILLLLVVLVGIRTEGFTLLMPTSMNPAPVQAYEAPQGRDECVQGLYKCANQRIPFGF